MGLAQKNKNDVIKKKKKLSSVRRIDINIWYNIIRSPTPISLYFAVFALLLLFLLLYLFCREIVIKRSGRKFLMFLHRAIFKIISLRPDLICIHCVEIFTALYLEGNISKNTTLMHLIVILWKDIRLCGHKNNIKKKKKRDT